MRQFPRRLAWGTACHLGKLAAVIMDALRDGMFSLDEILENQLGISGPTLESIVWKAAKPGMLALEIGSWAGASTAIIGKVVKENSGRLYCVDWWKGNIGLHDGVHDLASMAQTVDIFDIFEANMQKLGLDDAIYPLKMSSDVAARILMDECFDFIFIDAEHTYDGVRADIENYFPKLKVGGIFSGHDCEGKLEEFDIDYINSYKDIDFDRERGLHCGVIKAVGESFDDYQVEGNIWYLVKEEDTVVHPRSPENA